VAFTKVGRTYSSTFFQDLSKSSFEDSFAHQYQAAKSHKNDKMASTEASKAPNKVYGTLSKLPAISEGVVFTK